MSQLTANRFNDEHTLIYVQVRHALKITKDCKETAMEKTDLFEFDCKTFDEQQTGTCKTLYNLGTWEQQLQTLTTTKAKQIEK